MSLLCRPSISLLILCLCAVTSAVTASAQAVRESNPDYGTVAGFVTESIKDALAAYSEQHPSKIRFRSPRNRAEGVSLITETISADSSRSAALSFLIRPRDAAHRELSAFQRDTEAVLRKLGHVPTSGGEATLFGRPARTRDYVSALGPTTVAFVDLGSWNGLIVVQQRGHKPEQPALSLAARVMSFFLSHLERRSVLWKPDARPTLDPIAGLAEARAVEAKGRVRIITQGIDGEPVVWRGIAVQILAYDGRGGRIEVATVHDSVHLSAFGDGIELPSGLKRLELRGPSGNLIDVPIPPWRLP